MTYNTYGSHNYDDKNYISSKNLTCSKPRTFLSTYDTHINIKSPYRGDFNPNIVYRSSFYSPNKRYANDDSLFRTTKIITRKPSSSSSYLIEKVNFRLQPPYTLTTNELSYEHLLNQIAQITDILFLSGISAITMDRIRELGITMLVSLITDSIPVRASNLENVVIAIEDSEFANLRSHFDRVIDKIHREEIRGGKVLVHCIAGVSRSSSLVIAYLMKYHRMRLREAYNHVRDRRPYIQPNIGFWKQLIDFEKRLFGSASVKLIADKDKNTLFPDVQPSALASVIFNKYSKINRY